MSDWIDADGYRANVGIVLMRDDGRVFLGGRTGGRGWQFPQGGIRPDEPFAAALYRELEEEIGLEAGDVEFVGETRGWLRYRLPQQYLRTGYASTRPTSHPSSIGSAGRSSGIRCAR